MEMKTLVIGENYGAAFGIDADGRDGMPIGQMIYNGGNSWTAKSPKGERTLDSEATTIKVLAYYGNSVMMGVPK
jgi:hypothetical protein